jgi:hypothetical protein
VRFWFWKQDRSRQAEKPEQTAARRATAQLQADLKRALLLRAVSIERDILTRLEPDRG